MPVFVITLAMTVGKPVSPQEAVLTTATGYRLNCAVYGQEATGPLALIMMHGKNAPADGYLDRSARSAEKCVKEGVRVYVPIMPWSSRCDGTHEDATAAIDALVDAAARDGKKVILDGHSMGGMFTIIYRAGNLPPAVIGKFVSAPGHMLDMIPGDSEFWRGVNPSLAKASSLEAAGKGKDRSRFEGRNVSGARNTSEEYEMTPEINLSWHDPKRLPGSLQALRVTAVPVLWTVGASDPLVQANASESTFNQIPVNGKSRFALLVGRDHSTSLPASSELLIAWMKTLVAN